MTLTTVSAATIHRGAHALRTNPRNFRQTDADVYAEIARAWWLQFQPDEHPQHPMRAHLVVPGFAKEVWARDDVDPYDVLAVCARIVASADYQLAHRATRTQLGTGLREALDPTKAWWHPLTDTPDLGVHYWTLVVVPFELRCVGRLDQPPELEYGRFAEREARARPSVVGPALRHA